LSTSKVNEELILRGFVSGEPPMSFRAELRVIAALALVLTGWGVLSVWPSHERTAPDSDLDGIPDALEAAQSALYPEASPDHRDLYLDVFVRPGAMVLNTSMLQSITDYFATASVSNPDGSIGVRLHWRAFALYDSLDVAVNRTGVDPNGYHVTAFFEDTFCLDQAQGTCHVGGHARSEPPQVIVAAKRLAVPGANQTAADRLRQLDIRHTFMHELEHVLWWPLPITLRAGSENPHHTNIPGDAICETPVVPPNGYSDSIPGCDADGSSSRDRWNYAAAFWRQKESDPLLPRPSEYRSPIIQ
jgi:hypothetical protein